MRTVGKLESEAGVGVALAKHSEIETVWIPPMEMIVGVRLEEDLVSIPPIGRKIPAKLDTVVGKHWVKHFGTCACCKVLENSCRSYVSYLWRPKGIIPGFDSCIDRLCLCWVGEYDRLF